MKNNKTNWPTILCLILGLFTSGASFALETSDVSGLSSDSAMERIEAIKTIATVGDSDALRILQALQNSEVYVTDTGHIVVENDDGDVLDAISLELLDPEPEYYDYVIVNNVMRSELENAVASLQLLSPDRDVRMASAVALQNNRSKETLPLLELALNNESDEEIRSILLVIKAVIMLDAEDQATRSEAVQSLNGTSDRVIRELLASRLNRDDQGEYVESSPEVRKVIKEVVSSIDQKLTLIDYFGRLFSGLSLGSILLLAALGLAITYGLLGVINLAHGEMLMIGAYATYLTQQLFTHFFPNFFDLYVLAAIPIAFLTASVIGVILERTVIRWLYGRPLETLLATWGISLFLIQLVRQIFGAQNVEVSNPSWLSGGVEVWNVVMPYNRIAIIVFSLCVLVGVWLLISRTRLGLFIRSVTQNRSMASCVGVHTARVDLMAFGLGSGIAGLAGVALSQIGNVGPDLGQAYIIDSFMVVVLGGVGQLAGSVYAALGLGAFSKLIEPGVGAVLTKILILVFIIAVIQKRPQGLFALKGRAVEN